MLFESDRQQLIEEFREKARGYIGEEGISFALRVLSKLSIAGAAITDTILDMEMTRQWERATDIFVRFDDDLRRCEQQKIDKHFLKTEEFQTLVFLVIQQVQTTYDKGKLKALSDGLARGRLRDFSGDSRKELFFRILRDMAPNEFQILKNLSPTPERGGGPVIPDPDGEDLAILQRLEAHGLVRVSMRSNMKLSGPRYGRE